MSDLVYSAAGSGRGRPSCECNTRPKVGCSRYPPPMLNSIAAVVAVLFVAAVAVAFVVLVVSDVRRSNGEPLDTHAQRSLDAHRDAERRVNRDARSAGW